MNTIAELRKKIKSIMSKNDTFFIAVIMLIVVSFAGILKTNPNQNNFSPYIENDAFKGEILNREKGDQYQFSASKNGTKYYPKGCKSANRIKEKNRIFFNNEIDAVKAGYEMAKSC